MRTVSVVMCTYNGEKFLREQLDSLSKQTRAINEIIVQDDCSTDSTATIIENFSRMHPELNIIFFVNKTRKGFNRNFLSAIQKATGDYIACCDQDDIWLPEKIDTLLREIGDANLIFHNSRVFSETHIGGLVHTKNIPSLPYLIDTILSPKSYGHQIMFKRDIIEHIKLYSELNVSFDYFIYSLCGIYGDIKYLNIPLVKWRRHKNAATFSDNCNKGRKMYGYIKAVASLSKKPNIDNTRKYFSIISDFEIKDKDVEKIVLKMSHVNIKNILSICYLCLKHYKEFSCGCKGLKLMIRAFFMPLFFIRDYGQYIIKE